jgi:hypothetical protein
VAEKCEALKIDIYAPEQLGGSRFLAWRDISPLWCSCRSGAVSFPVSRGSSGAVFLGIQQQPDPIEVCTLPMFALHGRCSGRAAATLDLLAERVSLTRVGSPPGGVREVISKIMASSVIGSGRPLFRRKRYVGVAIGLQPCSLSDRQAV